MRSVGENVISFFNVFHLMKIQKRVLNFKNEYCKKIVMIVITMMRGFKVKIKKSKVLHSTITGFSNSSPCLQGELAKTLSCLPLYSE